ncbi:MAG: hypothetical protein ACPGSD_10690 [Flavobacteriales bacterium]
MRYFGIICFVCSLLLSLPSFAGFSISGNEIRVTGTETGNALRSWIGSNTSIGRVTDRDIIFNRDLRIQSGASFTDENATYQFPGSFRFEPQSSCTVNFTDIILHYTGNSKNHSFNSAYLANFTRVFYLQGVTSGRSDFFNNGSYNFNMSDVTFVSYGTSDYLHFQTADSINNITIVNEQGGLNFEPGARNAGQTEIINNLKLQNVSRMVGGSGALGDFKVYNLDWDAVNWNFTQRSVDFFFVNPIKPSNWNAYTGSFSRVKEYYTHDLSLIDAGGQSVSGVRVNMYNNYDLANTSGYSNEYSLVSDGDGRISRQEILKINNALAAALRNRGDFTFAVLDYNKKFQTQTRTFTSPVVDVILVEDDINVTESDATTVSNYNGISINHSTKELIISSSHSLCEVYDFIKYDKVVSNIDMPSLNTMFVDVIGETLNINDYKLILQNGADLTSCDKFLKIESSQSSTIAQISQLKVALEDANGLYKLIKLTNIDNASVLLKDEISGDTLLFESLFSGVIEFTTQSSSSKIITLVSKQNFSNWITELDLSQNVSSYNFRVSQVEGATLVGLATQERQQEELYLLQSILKQSTVILQKQQQNSGNTTLNISTTSPTTTNYPTSEQQEEALLLLKRILTKVTAIEKGE